MADESVERARVAALLTYEVMDTAAEPMFDRLTAIAAELFKAPIALITFVNESRQWIKSGFGTDLRDMARLQSFCTHTIARPEPLVVGDTHQDARFVANLLVTGSPAIRFYAGVPLVTPEGMRIGALCVIDSAPRPDFCEHDLAMLHNLAAVAIDLLGGRRQVLAMEREAQRARVIDAVLVRIADAPGNDAALDSVMRALAASYGAAWGQLWRRPAHQSDFRLVTACGDRQTDQPDITPPTELTGLDPVDGLLATALRQDQSCAVTIGAAAPFARDPLVATAHDQGLRHLLAVPFAAGEDHDVIVLGFADLRSDLAVLIADVTAVCAALKPDLARKVDEERLRLLNSALDMASDGVVVTMLGRTEESPRRIIYVNDSFCRSTGYAAAELIGQSPNMLHGPETCDTTLQLLRSRSRGGSAASGVLVNYRKDGSTFFAELDFAPIIVPDGAVRHVVGVQRDITSKLLDERKRRELDESFRMLFEENPLPLWVFHSETRRFLMVNEAAIAFYGWSREEFMAMKLDDIKPPGMALDAVALAGSRPMSDQGLWTHKRANGSIVQMAGSSRWHRSGGPHAILSVVWDVTEVQAARDHLKRNYEMVKDLAEQLQVRTAELTEASRLAKLGTWRLSADRSEMTWSDEIYTLIGRKRSEFPPSYENSVEVVHPDDRDLFKRSTMIADSEVGGRHVEARIVRPDGRVRHVRIEFRPNYRGRADGTLFGYVQDVSERWETQQALMRSEKLAILGHLTGGIAHDFNNLLTVVTLNLEEAIAELPETDDLHGILVSALQSAQRGADLTNQLLSYARQAPLRPKAISLSTFFKTSSPFIRRALGQKYDLRVAIEDEHCTPLVDSSQLQAAILNIALNARDAMPAGGEILIKAESMTLPCDEYALDQVAPGDYAMISVTDHGCGIAPGVMPRLFEPFYTTKEQGSGSGLGLSMVDGFVGQSGGRIMVQSQLGEGTTVRLFLPLTAEQGVNQERKKVGSSSRRALLVEDQPAVLTTVSRMFTQLGYDVCGVDSAAAALAKLDEGHDFAVMFTDIVLRGDMDGIALAREVARRAPAIRILLTSGFSEHNVSQLALPGSGLLMKPYKRQDLLDRLNEVMATLPG